MLRYRENAGYTHHNLEEMKLDYIDFMFCVRLLHESSTDPDLTQGYRLIIEDIALAVLLIDKMLKSELLEEEHINAVDFTSLLYTMMAHDFYEPERLQHDHYPIFVERMLSLKDS